MYRVSEIVIAKVNHYRKGNKTRTVEKTYADILFLTL